MARGRLFSNRDMKREPNSLPYRKGLRADGLNSRYLLYRVAIKSTLFLSDLYNVSGLILQRTIYLGLTHHINNTTSPYVSSQILAHLI